MKGAIILFSLAFSVLELNAQQPVSSMQKALYEVFSSNSGLSSDDVHFITQDSDGHLWICTDDGLNRFDGYEFKIYKPNYNVYGSFNSKEFTCACEASDGKLWLGTKNDGINIYDRKTGIVEILNNKPGATNMSLTSNEIKHLFKAQNGDIWIGLGNGINKYSVEQNKIIDCKKHSKFKFSGVQSIAEDYDGKIWFGTWGYGIIRYDYSSNSYTKFYINNDTPKPPVRAIYIDKKNTIWLGSWDKGLFRIDSISGDQLHCTNFTYHPVAKNSISGNIILSLNEDKYGNIWAGSPYGLDIVYNPHSNNPHIVRNSAPNKASSNAIKSIYRDKSDIMWLGTLGDGINKIDLESIKFQHYKIPLIDPQRKNQQVKCFHVTPENELFVGIKSLGFGLYNSQTGDLTPYSQLPFYKKVLNQIDELNTVNYFLEDSRGNLWIGSRYNGLILTNKDKNIIQWITPSPSSGGREITCILEDSKKNIWVGTNNGLLKMVYQDQNNSYDKYVYKKDELNPYSISGNLINVVYEDRNGIIWVGTNEKGLNRLITEKETHNQVSFKNYRAEKNNSNSLSSDDIYSIYEDNYNNFWICTGGGGLNLLHRDKEVFQQFEKSDGLEGDAVYDILEDESNKLWLSTNKGLCRFDPKKNQGFQFENFYSDDGLQSNIFIKGASYKTKDNHLMFGGYRGFNIFNPKDIHINKFIPPVLISDVSVFNEVRHSYLKNDETIILSHSDYSFTINFTALSYSQPNKNKYAFRLEGFDDNWNYTDASNRKAVYSNLRKGTYYFHVKAANNSGLWNNNPTKLIIVVKPAPYETWWAFTLYGISLAFILYGIYRFLLYRAKIRQELEIEQIERAKSEKLNQYKLRFFTNISHELLTPLSVLSCTINEYKPGNKLSSQSANLFKRNVDRLIRLINQLLIFRKIETGNLKLKVAKGDLGRYSQVLFENFHPLAVKNNIQFEFDIEPERFDCYFDSDKIDKILHNLLSNAFKYTNKNGSVYVSCTQNMVKNMPYARFSVSDTGKGIPKDELEHIFDRFYRLEHGSSSGSGIGLELTKNLVELHNGEISVESDPGKGTTFTISIPVYKEAYIEDQLSDAKLSEEQYTKLPATEDIYIGSNTIETEETDSEKKNSVLIVEDNADFRSVLKNTLFANYKVYEANNGAEGLKVAKKNIPNIIISDVMMPEMDGVEFCKQLKSTLEVSHIPVILLTAKVNVESRTEGYKAGADSYLAKPVDIKMLHTRIESLIEQRKNTHTKFKDELKLEPEKVTITSLDEKYIKRAVEIVEKNIDNPDFNVHQFAKETGSSNSMLYRKISAIAGMSPNEFIKSMRLKRAVQLLEEAKYTVAEVAYATGFTDQSYFGVCFKKQFGTTPSDFLQKAKDKKPKNNII
ncbi:MAG: ATP-binding protein [Bacteroidales bacterium]|nr:ATP-binding protein [Bacteroidales bacterium]